MSYYVRHWVAVRVSRLCADGYNRVMSCGLYTSNPRVKHTSQYKRVTCENCKRVLRKKGKIK